jgi:SCP1.201-like deaminase
MFAMPGSRAFSLSARGQGGVSCDADGVYVGDVSLLTCCEASGANKSWAVRPISEVNSQLSALYRLPVDAAGKASAPRLIATALNRGDMAMAAIATVYMQFPDPPPLAKGVESRADIERRATELHHSGLFKFWDPAKHPRAGTPPNPGWFALVGEGTESVTVVPVGDDPHHERHPEEYIGGHPTMLGGSRGHGGPLEIQPSLPLGLPFPRLAPRPPATGVPPKPPSPPPRPQVPPEPPPKLPLPPQSPQLAPYIPGGKTSGIFRSGNFTQELQSGYDGPASSMPQGSPGFDRYTMTHVEGHAAALMRRDRITDGTLYINNPEICYSCNRLLPKMLPPGSTLRIVLPDGTVESFEGVVP